MSSNEHKSKTVFHSSGVSWFAVPNKLFSGKSPLLKKLSAPELRLYLFLLSRAGENPFVDTCNADIAKYAGVGKNDIKDVREALARKHHLITVSPDGKRFELLDPTTAKRLPSALEKVKAGRYTPEQIETVFDHFLRANRLDDNSNGLRYICPCHTVGINSPSKRKKHPLNVRLSSSVGLWQCTDSKCSLHGKPRTDIETDNWGEPVADTVAGGGGDLLDFVATMVRVNGQKPITRHHAAEIVAEILSKQ